MKQGPIGVMITLGCILVVCVLLYCVVSYRANPSAYQATQAAQATQVVHGGD